MVNAEQLTCPDCGKPLTPKKDFGGIMACYCLWGGRKPTVQMVQKSIEEYEKQKPRPAVTGTGR